MIQFQTHAFNFDDQPISIKSCLVDIAHDYTKKKNVFRLKTFNGSEYLFQADENSTMLEWIHSIQSNNNPDADVSPTSLWQIEHFFFLFFSGVSSFVCHSRWWYCVFAFIALTIASNLCVKNVTFFQWFFFESIFFSICNFWLWYCVFVWLPYSSHSYWCFIVFCVDINKIFIKLVENYL